MTFSSSTAKTFTVTPTAGANGTISPSTVQTVNSGANVTFTATPNTGYTVATWSLDGSRSPDRRNNVTLSNVTANHTVLVTFDGGTFTVTPSAGTNGTISPNTPQTVKSGGSVTFTATPSAGYLITTWSVDAVVVQTGGTTFTLSNITANHTVLVSFISSSTTFTITPSAGANGTISPSTSQTVTYRQQHQLHSNAKRRICCGRLDSGWSISADWRDIVYIDQCDGNSYGECGVQTDYVCGDSICRHKWNNQPQYDTGCSVRRSGDIHGYPKCSGAWWYLVCGRYAVQAEWGNIVQPI